MILVLCGTQKQQFTRMINTIAQIASEHDVFVQAGHTQYQSDKMQIFDFITNDQLTILYNRADLIVTHGGAGSVFQAIKANKKTLVVPRLEKYHEHVDDHQLQLAKKLADLGYLQVFYDGDDFQKIFANLQKFTPKQFNLGGKIPALVASNLDQWLEKKSK